MKKTLIMGMLGLSLAGVSTAAARPSIDELEKFSKTGESESCVQIRSIRNTRVLDDRNILFYMTGGKVYLNTLPNKCSRLGFEQSFSYSTTGSRLCDVDIITVIADTFSGVRCGLGAFQELEDKSES